MKKKYDKLVKSPNHVTPAEAGVHNSSKPLDSRPCSSQGQALRGNDEKWLLGTFYDTIKYIFNKNLFHKNNLVKANFKITNEGLNALQSIKRRKRGSSNKEVFNLIYIFVASLGGDDSLIEFVPSKPNEEKIRKKFTLNSHTLAGLKELSREYAVSVDDLIDQGACFIKNLLDRSINKDQKFGSKEEALGTINEFWTQFTVKLPTCLVGLSGVGSSYPIDCSGFISS